MLPGVTGPRKRLCWALRALVLQCCTLRALVLQCFALQVLLPASTAQATAPQLAVSVAPALKGWSRPGKTTELDIRLSASTPTRVRLDVAPDSSGPPVSTVYTQIDLQPGRPQRLQLPVGAAANLQLRAVTAEGTVLERAVPISLSESPLLVSALAGVLAGHQTVRLDAFHTVALTADDLPRNASAYASINALVVDAATLSALDTRQLAALLAHAAACGRMVVVNADAAVQKLLEGAGGCGGRALLQASSVAQAQVVLAASLAAPVIASLANGLPNAMTLSELGPLARPSPQGWNRVALALALYFAATLAALLWLHTLRATAWLAVLLGLPALAAGAAWALLGLLHTAPELVVWSEGDAGGEQARYRAWQRVAGARREHTRVAIPGPLATSAQACDRNQALGLEFDPAQGRVTAAEFETRLFRQVLLCFSGSFPMARAPQLGPDVNGVRQVRNAGLAPWPAGLLLLDGRALPLPALGPGVNAVLAGVVNASSPSASTGAPATALPHAPAAPADQALQMAWPRVRPGGAAALWALDLGGVAAVPEHAQGWLLVSVPLPEVSVPLPETSAAPPASTRSTP